MIAAARGPRSFGWNGCVTSEHAAFFDEHGFIAFRNVFSERELDVVREEADRLEVRTLAGELPPNDIDLQGGVDPSGRRFLNRLLYFTEYCPRARAVIFDTCFAVARGLLGARAWVIEDTPPGTVRQVKVGGVQGGVAAIDWHVDNFTVADADAPILPVIAIGIYLEESRRGNGNLHVVPATHRAPLARAIVEPLSLEAEPGDVIVHATSVLHASGPMAPESTTRRDILYVFASGGAYPGHRSDVFLALRRRQREAELEPAFLDGPLLAHSVTFAR